MSCACQGDNPPALTELEKLKIAMISTDKFTDGSVRRLFLDFQVQNENELIEIISTLKQHRPKIYEKFGLLIKHAPVLTEYEKVKLAIISIDDVNDDEVKKLILNACISGDESRDLVSALQEHRPNLFEKLADEVIKEYLTD